MTLYGTETSSKYTKWILPMRYYPKYFLRTGPTTKWIQSTKYGLQYIVVVYWHKAHSPQLLVLSRLSVYTLMPTSNCFLFSSLTMNDAFVRPSADTLFTKSRINLPVVLFVSQAVFCIPEVCREVIIVMLLAARLMTKSMPLQNVLHGS